MKRRLTFAFAVASVAALGALAPVGTAATTAEASATQAAAAGTFAGDVRLNFKVNRFVRQNGRLVARGTAIGTYTSAAGQTYRVTKPVVFRVLSSQRSLSRICEVLTLRLNTLEVNLLGLIIRLEEPLVLRITANSRGGLLGRLLCSLAGGRGILNSRATTQRLNQALGNQSLGGTSLTAPLVAQQAQQPGECPILNLVLGPLDLNVLGLRVHLNRVHLTITASRGALLGDLLCGLTTTPIPVPPPTG